MSETEKAPWQAALDLLRLQRREAKIAAMEAKPKQYNSVQDMVDATSPELSQEFRDRKPNKVETLPREITWREVVEAVKAANQSVGGITYFEHRIGSDAYIPPFFVNSITARDSFATIDEALSYLRELAQPKPEPITPEKLWAECGGTGPIPEWAREAALAEAGRRNTKGGE